MKKTKTLIKFICICLALMLCGVLFACGKTPPEKTVRELFDETKAAVAQITVQSNYGTAFAIKKTDDALYVVTNHHTFTLSGGATITSPFTLQFFNGETASTVNGDAKLIGYNSYHDIAIIRIDKSSGAYAIEPLKVADGETFTGDPLFSIGNSQNMGLALFTGLLSHAPQSLDVNSNGVNKTVPVLQITVPVNKGSSGCPVLNYNGEVIGVGTYRIPAETAEAMYFCVPVKLALTYIDTIIATNAGGENNASECASANIKLIKAAEVKFAADYGIYGFQGIIKTDGIELTYVSPSIADLAFLDCPPLQAGDKITAFGDLTINGANIFDIIINGEKYSAQAQISDSARLRLTVQRGDEVFYFTYKSIFKKA